jgi:predicted transcriptional regulator
MRQENVHYFTDAEEKLTDLLIGIGTRKTVAIVLVFLANVPETTSREIERGTGLRQPEVSIAIKHMTEQGWINSRAIASEKKGRPVKLYSLKIPVKEIVAALENEKKSEINDHLACIRKLRNYLT